FDSTSRSLVALRNNDTPSIAHCASSTIARLAYHLQCDIVYRSGGHYCIDIIPCFRALYALQLLHDQDGTAKADLQRQLMLGHARSNLSSPISATKWEKLCDSWRDTKAQPS